MQGGRADGRPRAGAAAQVHDTVCAAGTAEVRVQRMGSLLAVVFVVPELLNAWQRAQLRGCVKPFAALAEQAQRTVSQRLGSRGSTGDPATYRSTARQARPSCAVLARYTTREIELAGGQ